VARLAVDVGGGQEAGQESAERAAHGVDAEGVERVVVARSMALSDGAGEVGHHGGEDADDHRTGRIDEAGGRRDDDQAGDRHPSTSRGSKAWPRKIFSITPQTKAATAAASVVVVKALAATPSAATALNRH